ncbi:hypothetical protein PN478_03765 [Dolichospermum circinale CS-534/05]|uniref:hypothetical protein n=1 Tax=Dolichospermum circinale TaxID=109265 RepID=UPI00232DB881|nr:hypothetical protein [Dolichospermum circinale]MDB9489644.1 hypothetical protein [Dolichospermum circinale CS-534/05]
MNDEKIGSLREQVIENLYQEVFDTIYKQIETQQKGVLSTVIYSILDPNDSKAKELCQFFEIKDNGTLNDDLSVSSTISSGVINILIKPLKDKKQYGGLIDNLDLDKLREVFNKVLYLPQEIISTFDSTKKEEKKKMELYLIVAIGCLIVGVPSCVIYLQNQKQEQRKKENHKNSPSPQPKVFTRISLCLIVPVSVVRSVKINARENCTINVSDIEILIENASYFLCTNAENDTIDKSLSLTDEDITNLSEEREVYVRIRIGVYDADKMIGNKVRYILKTNLPANGQGTVTKLGCLEYLSVSGLEKFNRI